ncbi:hypothetical protein SAMN05421504_108174 [Amycolatopsis xylanica]|uniref:Uncharacterized protein n=1 Tax=Amycolatopsis xylanica TaxID=589385 RepID=A0A1H3PEF8_9PSEU|nr:hypothetical protein [Amycolatopsis xylanica]SDY99457.1 hypothetical protein SAMN05421504_108174 [Amycolatopsis xylanica]
MEGEITTRVGQHLYTFDGRVFEIFGTTPVRFHVEHMYLQVTDPDRKGRRTVTFHHGTPEAPGSSHSWTYSAAELAGLPELLPFLEAVRAAIRR